MAAIFAALVSYFFPIAYDPFPNAHYSWVHFHFMSILQNTTSDNYFVGYTFDVQLDKGVEPFYFNRYSPISMVAFHYMLSGLSFISKISALKYFFSVIFICNCLCMYSMCRILGLSELAAASVTFVIAGQYYFLYPRDMAHFDQMALLGLFIQLLLILKGRLTAFFVFTIFALHLGRNFMLIFTSGTLYSCLAWRRRDLSYLALLLVHLVSFVSSFAYNVAVEMHVTGKQALDTSILWTFQNRVGLQSSVPIYERADWITYGKIMLWRIGEGIFLKMAGPMLARLTSLIVLVGAVSFLYIRGLRNIDCRSLCIIAPAIIFFILARKLIFFHDYTLMWFIPLATYLLVECTLFVTAYTDRLFRDQKWWRFSSMLVLVGSFAYLAAAMNFDKKWKEGTFANGLIERLAVQREHIGPGHLVCVVKEVPRYALQAILPGAIYSDKVCEYTLNGYGISSQ